MEPKKIERESSKKLLLEKVSWVNKLAPIGKISVVLRYHGEQFLCSVTEENRSVVLLAAQEFPRVAKGQSAVLYRGSQCLGGGVIA